MLKYLEFNCERKKRNPVQVSPEESGDFDVRCGGADQVTTGQVKTGQTRRITYYPESSVRGKFGDYRRFARVPRGISSAISAVFEGIFAFGGCKLGRLGVDSPYCGEADEGRVRGKFSHNHGY